MLPKIFWLYASPPSHLLMVRVFTKAATFVFVGSYAMLWGLLLLAV